MLDMGFDAYGRDHGIGGGVLGGALAFRLFLVALPAFLAGIAALGFVAEADSHAAEDIGRRAGLAESAVQSLSQSARLAQGGRWTTMAFALVLMLLALRLLVKSLRIVQALAWQVPISKVRLTRALPAAVVLVLVIAAIAAASAWLRERTPGGGVGVAVALIVIWFVPWSAILLMLPRAPEAPWTTVLPGAFVLSVGTQLLHAATIYYFSAKIPEMSEIYGPLGLAAVSLLWLYVVGRTFVASSVLNATIWDRKLRGVPSFPDRVDALFDWIEQALGADPSGPRRRRGD